MPVRVLFANEPRAYREVLAAALATLRPHVEAVALAPGNLDGVVARLRPRLVVCSRLTAAVEAGAPNWVLLHPDGAPGAVVCAGGERTTVAKPDFDGLLALVDRLGGGPAGHAGPIGRPMNGATTG